VFLRIYWHIAAADFPGIGNLVEWNFQKLETPGIGADGCGEWRRDGGYYL
jgi:hypothetical protein